MFTLEYKNAIGNHFIKSWSALKEAIDFLKSNRHDFGVFELHWQQPGYNDNPIILSWEGNEKWPPLDFIPSATGYVDLKYAVDGKDYLVLWSGSRPGIGRLVEHDERSCTIFDYTTDRDFLVREGVRLMVPVDKPFVNTLTKSTKPKDYKG